MKNIRNIKAELLGWLFTISLSVLILWFVVNFAVGISIVKGSSMEPTLATYDKLFLNKTNFRVEDIKYGDIVTFHNPENKDESYIKRIIALEGDIVEIIENTVYVNGNPLKENYTNSNGDTELENGSYWEISKGEVFVLGDNRHVSYDSRSFGPIDKESIIGVALFRFYPFDKMGRLNS